MQAISILRSHDMILRAHPLAAPGLVQVSAGQNLMKMLQQAGCCTEISPDVEVRVGGHVVPQAQWERIRPKEKVCITVTRNSLAGGGDGWKQALGAIALIVVSIYAPGWGTALVGETYGALAGAALTLVAPLCESAIIGSAA